MAKTDIATTNQATAVAAVYDYGDDAGIGFEGISAADMSIPFITVMQPMSPEVVEEIFRSGQMVNSVTKEVIQQPLILQPVYRECLWVEWVPRKSGGGYVGAHLPDSDVVKKIIADNGGSRVPPKDSEGKRKPFKLGQNEVVETHYVYCVMMDETGMEQVGYCVLSFTSTKVKVHKDWVSSMMMQRGRPPMIAFRAQLSTSKQQSDGGTYFNFDIKPFGGSWTASLLNPNDPAQRALMDSAKDFRDLVVKGIARAATETLGNEEAAASGGGQRQQTKPMDRGYDGGDDIPF